MAEVPEERALRAIVLLSGNLIACVKKRRLFRKKFISSLKICVFRLEMHIFRLEIYIFRLEIQFVAQSVRFLWTGKPAGTLAQRCLSA